MLQAAHLIQGPTVEISIESAITLISVLRQSKKFASNKVQNFLSQIYQSDNHEDYSNFLKMVMKTNSSQIDTSKRNFTFFG